MANFRLQPNEEVGVSNWVTSRLREAILSGAFEPGEKLSQDRIADDFKVSRTPVREAMKVLAAEGFVEIQSYRGVYIPEISARDVKDVFEFRWIIEPEITRQSTPLISQETIDSVSSLLDQSVSTDGSILDHNYYDIDKQFHDAIVKYCQNRLLLETLEKINYRIVRVRNFAIHQPGTHLNHSHQEHIQILNAIRRRDADEASRLMELHLKNSADRIMKYIAKP
jgi:DNA-binding GntR family transcriptional regulator